ncbi:MAG: ABC transporter ATP-binding protein [Pseudoclavibacter sp.]
MLRDFSLSVARGEVHGLLGPNGSGKSTGLHVISGLVPADTGTVVVCGRSIRAKSSRAYLGFAPDDLQLPAFLTGKEYLQFHDSIRGRHDDWRSSLLVDLFGIRQDMGRQIVQYSHGMKRKIQIIAALMHQPELLILDEPFRGLDPDASLGLRSLLSEFAASGRAVLVATHDMLRAERDCHTVTILNRGAIVAAGRPRDLVRAHARSGTLEEVFLSLTGLMPKNELRAAAAQGIFDPNGQDGDGVNE